MKNYIFNSIDTRSIIGDKPIPIIKKVKKKRKKMKKPFIRKYPRFVNRDPGIWNIPDNF